MPRNAARHDPEGDNFDVAALFNGGGLCYTGIRRHMPKELSGMRRGTCGVAALVALCVLLPGCAREPVSDPLAAFGADAELPHVTAAPTACTPAPTATPAPTQYVYWAELPLDESDGPAVERPTRRPTSAPLGAQLSGLIGERQLLELDSTGALQANVTAPGMACEFEGDTIWLYFTAADGRLYRERIAEGANVSWDPANAQRVTADRAQGLMVSLRGDVVYMCGSELVRLEGGESRRRTVMATFDALTGITRWDDTLYAVASRGGAEGLFALNGESEPLLIIPSARAVQIDVVNRRIVALDDAGLTAYSLEGDRLAPMIEGSITAFCHSGADLYYSTENAVYRLGPGGTVERVAELSAVWLGCMNGRLFYLDGARALRSAAQDGSDEKVLSEGPVYNPTLLTDRIAWSLSETGGLEADAPY